MGRKPIPDQLLREILRLRSQGKSFRAIAAICGVGRTTAQDYYRLARSKGLDWSDVKHHSNVKLKTELQSPKLKPSAYDEPVHKSLKIERQFSNHRKEVDEIEQRFLG